MKTTDYPIVKVRVKSLCVLLGDEEQLTAPLKVGDVIECYKTTPTEYATVKQTNPPGMEQRIWFHTDWVEEVTDNESGKEPS